MGTAPLKTSLRPQRTLARAVEVDGFGYWSGRDVRLEFHPAPADFGIQFIRTDLEKPTRIPVHPSARVEMPRRTTLARDGASVEMVEHVLAALYGMAVDNCEVRVNRAEMPGCDGSSMPFVEALLSAGIVAQRVSRTQLVVTEPTRVGNEEAWVEARPATASGMWIKYHLDYGATGPIGRQVIKMEVTPETFAGELAPARTFVLREEAEWMRARGLGARVTCQDLLVFDDHGPVDNPLRFPDECVRHKALDLIGDLALAGCQLVGQFSAYRSGHRLNAELVKVLLTEAQLVQGNRRSA